MITAIRTPASSWAITTSASTTSHHGESVRKLVTGTMMCSVHQSVNARVVFWTFSSIHRSAEFTGDEIGCTQLVGNWFAQRYCWPCRIPNPASTMPTAYRTRRVRRLASCPLRRAFSVRMLTAVVIRSSTIAMTTMARPALNATPMFSESIALTTTCPSPGASISAAIVTIDSAAIVVWLMPSTIVFFAIGSCTLRSSCIFVEPSAVAASTVVPETSRIPTAVSRITGGTAYTIVTIRDAVGPIVKISVASGRYAKVGRICMKSRIGVMKALKPLLSPATMPSTPPMRTDRNTAHKVYESVSMLS